jgi:hypothetical protein
MDRDGDSRRVQRKLPIRKWLRPRLPRGIPELWKRGAEFLSHAASRARLLWWGLLERNPFRKDGLRETGFRAESSRRVGRRE